MTYIFCTPHCFPLPCPVCKDRDRIEALAGEIERLELELGVAQTRIEELLAQLREAGRDAT
jgi:hypothetical protein